MAVRTRGVHLGPHFEGSEVALERAMVVSYTLPVVAIIISKYKQLRLQHRLTAIKSHIQNSTNHFFWDNVIARSHCTYNPLDVTPVNVSLHSKLVTL